MKKNLFKFSLLIMSGVMVGTVLLPATTVFAESNDTALNSSQNSSVDNVLEDDIVEISNNYIFFDNTINKFIIDNNLKTKINNDDFEKVSNQVDATNRNINLALTEANFDTEVSISNNGVDEILKYSLSRGAGKSYVTYHWNYARIRISAGALRGALSVGFAIGSVYAPAKAVQAACAVAGLGTGQIKHGIWFDYNYFTGIFLGRAGLQ